MEILEKLRQWLLTYPGWGDGGLTVEHTDGRPGSAGLFLAGIEELQHQPDLQGNTLVCNRLHLVLERNETEKCGCGSSAPTGSCPLWAAIRTPSGLR